MKPLERVFFQACVMRTLLSGEDRLSFRMIVDVFVALGFPQKKLWYYIDKWDNKDFYDYGTTADLGWFYPDKFEGEYKVIYDDMLQTKKKRGDGK